jgi:hypothetical protein
MIDYNHFGKYIILGLVIGIILKLSYKNLPIDIIIFISLTLSLLYAILDKASHDNFMAYENTGYNAVEDDRITANARLNILQNQERDWFTKLNAPRNAYIPPVEIITKDGINIIEPDTWGKSPNLEFQDSRRILNRSGVYEFEKNEQLLNDFDKMREYSDRKEPTIDEKNYGYKLMFGEYAWGVLQAGYNDYINEANKDELNARLSRYPDAIITSEMYPGNITEHFSVVLPETKTETETIKLNPDIYSDFTEDTKEGFVSIGINKQKETFAQSQTPTPTPTPTQVPSPTSIALMPTNVDISYSLELDNGSRMPNGLYSGDLIMLFSPDKQKVMQRGNVDSQIVFDLPLKYIGTNLSKVRFVLKTQPQTENARNYPISYGDVVYLKHNIYYNNKNTDRFIKYGDRLQSHQDGNLFNEYVIFNKNNLNDKSPVQINEPFILSKNETTSSATFLTIELNGTVSSASALEKATGFNAIIYRPTELYNKHLDIALGDIIFP